MSKAILFTDVHAHKWPQYATVKEGIHSRVYYSLDAIKQMATYARENSVKVLIFAGDLFHKKSYIDTATHDLVFNLIFELGKEFDIYMLPGNHDMADKGKYNALTSFKGAVKHVAEKPCVVTLYSGKTVAMLPYLHNKLTLKESVSELKADILIAHDGCIGASLNGMVMDKDGVDPKVWKSGKHKKVFLGHWHDHECLIDPVINFIGTLIPNSAGDPKDGNFIVYDFDTYTFERVKVKTPQFVKMNEEFMEAFSKEELECLCESNYVHFDLEKENKVVTELKKKFLVTAKIKPVRINYETRLNIDVKDDISAIATKYAEKYGVGKLDMNRLIKMGLDIIETVGK